MAGANERRGGRRGWWVLAVACAGALVTAAAGAAPASPGPPGSAPGAGPKGAAAGGSSPARSVPIPGQYIVTLKPGVDVDGFTARERGRGNQVDRVYRFALNGYAGRLGPADVERLSNDPRVELVEQDATVSTMATQSNPTWGLDRVDQRLLPLSNSYTYSTTASNVTAYIIDTGIRATHNDFGGRVVAGYDAVGGVNPPTDDCNGHGTHVAGTVGGSTYGVAKGVTLVAVRVLNCQGSGTTSGVVAGVDWVTQHHQAGVPAVANMSLGASASTTLDDAVANSVADGITYAIAAGNSSANACNYSPARVPSALTVGATDSADNRASFSNFGTCVDLFAPGVGITSAWKDSDTATKTISGTSMAAPHVAGVAALTLAATPGATVSQVSNAILDNATPGIVGNPGCGSPNRLLYVGSEAKPSGSSAVPANDNFANGVVLGGASGSANGSNVGGTKETGEPNHAGNAGCASIWYRMTPSASGTATIDTVGSNFDTLLAVYTGSSVSSLTLQASNDDISYPSNLQSRVSLSVTAGVTYHIAVDGWGGATGSVKLNWSGPGSSSTTTTTSTTSTTTSTTTTSTTTTTTTTTAPPSPTVSISDASVVEGNGGKRNLVFTVTLSAPRSSTVTMNYATRDGTAKAIYDYQAKSGTVSIPAGTTTGTITISVYGDRVREGNEVFYVDLTNLTSGVGFSKNVGVGTIVDDD